ncbi:LysR family transcriptional regulator substrate-binding protein [Brevibacillus laterosporus]|uniref:LysR family transcriptional regulator substrate-binding protein n=1 Tax=Brevibacillus laterosporus TaxID=1465 RepID=UPI000B9AE0E9
MHVGRQSPQRYHATENLRDTGPWEGLLESEVDIGIGINIAPNDRLATIPICKEEYVLTVSKRNPLANRTCIDLDELYLSQNINQGNNH